jgi:hypothetical protein
LVTLGKHLCDGERDPLIGHLFLCLGDQSLFCGFFPPASFVNGNPACFSPPSKRRAAQQRIPFCTLT